MPLMIMNLYKLYPKRKNKVHVKLNNLKKCWKLARQSLRPIRGVVEVQGFKKKLHR